MAKKKEAPQQQEAEKKDTDLVLSRPAEQAETEKREPVIVEGLRKGITVINY